MILQPIIKIKVEMRIQLLTDSSLPSIKVSFGCQICDTLARPQAKRAVFQHCYRERGIPEMWTFY